VLGFQQRHLASWHIKLNDKTAKESRAENAVARAPAPLRLGGQGGDSPCVVSLALEVEDGALVSVGLFLAGNANDSHVADSFKLQRLREFRLDDGNAKSGIEPELQRLGTINSPCSSKSP
jgi:hypothetical protein